MNDLDSLVTAAEADFYAAPQAAALENAKAKYLGKSGRMTELLKGLGALPPEEKKRRGAEINQAKTRIETLLTAARERLSRAELEVHFAPKRWTSRCLAASAAWVACTR